jgi:hypothetical protein
MRYGIWWYLQNVIVKAYDAIGIEVSRSKTSKQDSCTFVEFKNGDIYNVMKASDAKRGVALNVSIIECGRPTELIHDIIKPCTKFQPRTITYYIQENRL